MKEAYVAIDFGGGSGRVIAGCLSEGELVLDTIYRFPNRQVRMGGHVYWDFLSLFEDMKTGIRMAVEKGYTLKSIGIDTWGVDFGLIDKQGNLLGNPVCYRESYGRDARRVYLEGGRKGALCRIGYAGHGHQYLVSVVCHEEGRQCAVEGGRQVAFHARPVQLLPYGSG